MFLTKKLGSRGDTIVEVLFAVTIVAAALTGAYITSSKSAKLGRQSQERGEALKIAESQIELLRAAVLEPTPTIFTKIENSDDTLGVNPRPFCLNVVSNAIDVANPKGVASSWTRKDLSSYPAACIRNSLYKVSVILDRNDVVDGKRRTYEVMVVWDRLGGGGAVNIDGTSIKDTESVTLSYRITR